MTPERLNRDVVLYSGMHKGHFLPRNIVLFICITYFYVLTLIRQSDRLHNLKFCWTTTLIFETYSSSFLATQLAKFIQLLNAVQTEK